MLELGQRPQRGLLDPGQRAAGRRTEADLDDLCERLANTRWSDELAGVSWSRGVPLAQLKDLAEYWRTSYDWRAHEASLNEHPQFTTTRRPEHALPARTLSRARRHVTASAAWLTGDFLDVVGPLSDPRAHARTQRMPSIWSSRHFLGSDSPHPWPAPTGVLVSAHDMTIRPWAERDHNIVR